jgi:tetrahydromethanopterin S-methyltransferase subunit G
MREIDRLWSRFDRLEEKLDRIEKNLSQLKGKVLVIASTVSGIVFIGSTVLSRLL